MKSYEKEVLHSAFILPKSATWREPKVVPPRPREKNMEVDDDGDYPLNCIDDTGDGFSGWFAISNPRQCNDFCYWKLPEDEDRRAERLVYAAWNTANPHKSTVITTPLSGIAYWTCVYDSANDQTLVSLAQEQRWIDSFQKYYSPPPSRTTVNKEDVPFPYLKCQKGSGELLASWSGDAVTSATFWEISVVFISMIFVGEFVALYFICWKRRVGRLTRYAQVVPLDDGLDVHESRHTLSSLPMTAEGEDNDDSVGIQFMSTQSSTLLYSNKNGATSRCKHCNRRRLLCILQILLVILLNGVLIVTLSFFSLSLNEIVTHSYYSNSMQKFTPACSGSMLICPAGNIDIDKQSSVYSQLSRQSANSVKYEDDLTIESIVQEEEEVTNDNIMQPFSYIIASDAQLYWFNGEFASMGQQALPPSCTASDSCARCTSKHGQRTNRRLQQAWESLMLGKTTGMNNSTDNINLPIPNTLVMNGKQILHFWYLLCLMQFIN